MKIKNFSEARQEDDNVSYEEVKKRKKDIDSDIDRVVATLSGSKSASITRLARTFKRIKFIEQQQKKLRDRQTEQIKEVSEAFFDESDKIYTRVLQSIKYIVTLSKETEHPATTRDKVNHEAILTELAEIMPDLEDTLAVLLKKHTEVIQVGAKITPTRLTSVKPVEIKESANMNVFRDKLASYIDPILLKFDQQFATIKFKKKNINESLSRWQKSGARQMIKDFDAVIGFTERDQIVYGDWHDRAFPDGVPVLKYFERGGGVGWSISQGEVNIPKDSVIVMMPDGDGYTYVEGYGNVSFKYENYDISNKPEPEECSVCGDSIAFEDDSLGTGMCDFCFSNRGD